MSDAEILARVQARAEANLYWRYLGVSVVDAKPGWVRLRVPVRDELKNAEGAPVHGGVYSALVDMAVGGALGTLNEASEGGVAQTTLRVRMRRTKAAGPLADRFGVVPTCAATGKAPARRPVRIMPSAPWLATLRR